MKEEPKQLYGLVRNYRGLKEMRYLYTKDQLAEHIPAIKGPGSPERYWDSFRADDTYCVRKLNSEEEVRAFVTGEADNECDFDDPSLLDLSEWYSEFAEDDLFTGKENPTAVKYLADHGLAAENLDICDWRLKELLECGIPEKVFRDRAYAASHRYHEFDKLAG